MINKTRRRRGILYISGALIVLLPPAAWVIANIPATPQAEVLVATGHVTNTISQDPTDLTELARQDPLALVKLGRERYERQIERYRCTLVKQERLGDGLSEVQEVELRFREDPLAIYMLWKKNADKARRALYMEGPDYVDGRGRKLTRVEPNGAIARLFTTDIFVQAHGDQARKSSRRTIDEAGFHTTFQLFEAYHQRAEQRGVGELRYAGTGEIDGRPTYIIERRLPYEGAGGPFPDAKLVLHLDQEWLLPVAVYSFADSAGTELLGSYVFKDVELNPEFSEDAFKF